MIQSQKTIQLNLIVNGEARMVECDVSTRLLDLLREELRLTGTKEGCGKGECGACTVIMDDRTVDSCLVMAYQAQDSEIWTVEGLPKMWQQHCSKKGARENAVVLHPLQKTFVECGSSQCGICIPGMIMSGAHLLRKNPDPSYDEIRRGLAGNLCRCTGYVKIFDAVRKAAREMRQAGKPKRVKAPAVLHSPSAHSATRLKEALAMLARGSLRQIAGGTDSLVRAKEGIGTPAAMFDIFKIPELRGIQEIQGKKRALEGVLSRGEIRIGAATTFTEIVESSLLNKYAPALVEACAVVGGPQIRNRGTLGGNLANASPAADSVPALMSMGAILEIASLKKRREIPVEGFFLGPGKTVLRRDELIIGIRIPRINRVIGCYQRLGQRQAQAISKVDVAVTAVVHPKGAANGSDQRLTYVGLCYGSVGPVVFRARQTERILKEHPINSETLRRAKEMIKTEVRPIDDIRSSAEYRREMSAVLLERALVKIGLLSRQLGVVEAQAC